MHDMITIFFKLINFGIVLFLAYYAFRRYVLDHVRQQKQEQERYWQNMEENKKSLIERHHNLTQDIAWQDSYAQELLEKIGQWQRFVQHERDQELHERQQLKMLLEQRKEQQRTYMSMEHGARKVIPTALAQSRERLIQQYKQPASNEQYIETILQNMERVVHED